jgi:DNA gyrase/topoisomerase IV, subunit A
VIEIAILHLNGRFLNLKILRVSFNEISSRYAPIIPMVLVNGADGTDTDWMSTIPSYNPRNIIDNTRRLLEESDLVPMTPWYKGTF